MFFSNPNVTFIPVLTGSYIINYGSTDTIYELHINLKAVKDILLVIQRNKSIQYGAFVIGMYKKGLKLAINNTSIHFSELETNKLKDHLRAILSVEGMEYLRLQSV
jgi:hypothetical protein